MNIYLVVGILFLFNLILTLALRARDKKEQSLKNYTMKMKTFRNEVASTIERINTSTKDCECNINKKIEDANNACSTIADSIDFLRNSQKDLANLQDVVVNYKIGLEKLRITTEQANQRVQLVQQEIRKAEQINEFAAGFNKESERLINQMQDMKAEYVRLVASTEESLRAAGENQKSANQDMLSAFSTSLERFKGQFIEFVNVEKSEYMDICNEQERDARSYLDAFSARREEVMKEIDERSVAIQMQADDISSKMDDKRNAILENVDEGRNEIKTLTDEAEKLIDELKAEAENAAAEANRSLEEFRTRLCNEKDAFEKAIDEIDNANRSDLERRSENLRAQSEAFDERIAEQAKAQLDAISAIEEKRHSELDAFNSDMEALGKKGDDSIEALSASVSQIIEAAEDSINKKFEAFAEEISRKSEEEKAGNERFLETFRSECDKAVSSLISAAEDATGSLEKAISGLSKERNAFVDDSREVLKKSFEEELEAISEKHRALSDGTDEMVKNLASRVQETRQTIALLSQGENEKIGNTIEKLHDLENKIHSSEIQLSAVNESITSAREELLEVQQERGRLEADLDLKKQELSEFGSELEKAKSDRMNEEAALVRLKMQISALKKEHGLEKEDVKEEAPSISIEEFPSDIFIGDAEEVDLSDDE